MMDRPTLLLCDVQVNAQHSLQDDLDAALVRIEEDIEAHMAANHGEWPTKAYRISIPLEIIATNTNLRALAGRVETTFPKIGRKHVGTLIGRAGQMVLDKPAGQETLPLQPGKVMEMVA
jgi:hypothetical protein